MQVPITQDYSGLGHPILKMGTLQDYSFQTSNSGYLSPPSSCSAGHGSVPSSPDGTPREVLKRTPFLKFVTFPVLKTRCIKICGRKRRLKDSLPSYIKLTYIKLEAIHNHMYIPKV